MELSSSIHENISRGKKHKHIEKNQVLAINQKR